jgi:acyl-CoA thioesterase FadM
VHRCEIDFRQPARLNDTLDVSVEAVKLGASTLKARQEVLRGADVMTSALVTLACLDAARWRPVRMPASLAAKLENPT